MLTFFCALFLIFGLIMDSPQNILTGLYNIIICQDVLITDYIEVGGIGATFVNAGILMLLSVLILYFLKVDISGFSIAAIFLMGSFALFGKNIFNVWPVVFGVYLYTKIKKEKLKDYIHIALLATSMAPVVTEFIFIIESSLWFRIPVGLIVGLSIGFFLPPLCSHMLKFHKGFCLYNIGFTVGLLGTLYVSVFKSYGYTVCVNLSWSTGNDFLLGGFLTVFFFLLMAIGSLLEKNPLNKLKGILACSGRLHSDFLFLQGFGATLLNMGINGFLATFYVILVGGPLNGPTMGGILTVVGFGAYGKHIRNIIPILLGVFLGSLSKTWSINDPYILLVALFGTALAPIAGYYGWFWGVVASFVNSSVVLNSGILHGGMNLYNTGFSAGIVASVMVPLLDAFYNPNPKGKKILRLLGLIGKGIDGQTRKISE